MGHVVSSPAILANSQVASGGFTPLLITCLGQMHRLAEKKG